MDIRLLGPVMLYGPVGEVEIGPPIRRCVLAALAVDAGRVVATEELIRRVWGDEPPGQVRKTLQAHVARLRKVLAVAGGGALVNRNGGYALLIAPEQTDLGRFRARINAGRAAMQAGKDKEAASCYRQAATLWRGGPLGGVDGTWIADFRVTLTDHWLTAAEARLEIELRLGGQTEVVDDALALAKTNLGREHLVALAMQCLYRCGRQAESLELCRKAMLFLTEDGMQPGSELRSVQERILRNDPSLNGTRRTAEPVPVLSAARRDLVREMRRLWLAHRPDPESRVELLLREQPGAVWDGFTERSPPDLGTFGPVLAGARLADLVLDRFNRRLLVLGGKGSGKTTSLVDLAADLLAQAENPEVPVPVILLLSSWRNRGTDLGEWIVKEIRDQYRLRADWVRGLLAGDDLVVLLDGLDEVPANLQAACARAINAFRIDSSAGIVVSSRTLEYGELDICLALAGAVTIEPLTEAQIDARLHSGGAALAGLRDAVRRDPKLAEHLSTPHMLDVVCVAYREGTGSVSPTTGGAYDQYLATLLHRSRAPLSGVPTPTAPFDVPTTLRFIVWLARLMTARGETMWYPDRLMPRALPDTDFPWPLPDLPFARLAAKFGLRRLATALTYGLAAAILCATMYALQLGLGRVAARNTPLDASPLFAALVALAVFVLVTAVFIVRDLPWRARITMYALILMLTGGLHKGLITARDQGGVAGWQAGVTGAVVYGLTTAASIALALGTVAALLRLEKDSSRWGWSWRRAVLCADTTVACGLAVGISHAVARLAAAPNDAGYSLLAGFGYGVIMGFGGGVLLGLCFMLVDLDVAQPAAQWHVSVRRLTLAMLATAGFGILNWLCFVYGVQLILGPDKGPLFALVLGVAFCLAFALGHSLIPEENLPAPAPARALGTSLRVAVGPVSAGLIALLATALTRQAVVEYVELALAVPAALAALLTFWFTGGGVWLAHHMARRTARYVGVLPPDLLRFLAYAEEYSVLHRHGGGYRFPHPELQRHVAHGVPDSVRPRS